MKKRILSLLLSFVMLLGCVAVSSCGKNEDKLLSTAATTKNLKNIYSAQEFETKGTALENYHLSLFYQLDGHRVLAEGYDRKDYKNKYFVIDIYTHDVKELAIDGAENQNAESYVMSVTADKKTGELWYIQNIFTYAPVENPPDDQISIDGDIIGGGNVIIEPRAEHAASATLIATDDIAIGKDYAYTQPKEEFFIVKVGTDGEIVSKTEISTLLKHKDDQGNEYNYYVNNLVVLDSAIALNCGETILIVDKQNFTLKNTLPSDNYYNTLFASSKGTLYSSLWGDNSVEFHEIDVSTGKSVKLDFPENFENYTVEAGGKDYDFYLANQDAFFGYNIGDKEPTEICNYTNSDINTGYGHLIPAVLDDGRLVINVRDFNTDDSSILILTRMKPEEIKEKYVITLAYTNMGSEFRSEIIDFNRTNDKYKVVLKSYSEYNNEENKWQGGDKKIAEDLMSKDNAPDMVLISTYSETFDFESLASKGVFADIESFMNADDDFDSSEYLENVFEAQKINGKLFTISPAVQFTTLAGKKSQFGKQKSWTMQDFMKINNGLAEGENMFNEPTRENQGISLLTLAIDEYINDNGKCSFTDSNFKNLLAYLKDMPKDYTAYEDEWNNNPTYWEDSEMSYSKGTTKLYETSLYTFDIIPYLEARMGEEISLIGFPSSKQGSNGVVIRADNEIAISAATKVPEGAWEVIKRLLSDDFQERFSGIDDDGNKTGAYYFPIKKDILKERMKADLIPFTYTIVDENGNETEKEEERIQWMAGTEVEVRKSTNKDTQLILDLISNSNIFFRRNQKVEEIILQEAEFFFNGAKSVDAVADIINSKIQILVSERM